MKNLTTILTIILIGTLLTNCGEKQITTTQINTETIKIEKQSILIHFNKVYLERQITMRQSKKSTSPWSVVKIENEPKGITLSPNDRKKSQSHNTFYIEVEADIISEAIECFDIIITKTGKILPVITEEESKRLSKKERKDREYFLLKNKKVIQGMVKLSEQF